MIFNAQVSSHDTHGARTAVEPHEAEALTLAMFDEIACGLMVCDEQQRIHFANRAAQQELASEHLLMQRHSLLRTAAKDANELNSAVLRAARSGHRSLVRLIRGDDELLASVLPLQVNADELHRVLFVLGRRQPCSDLELQLLACSYGLTTTERRVLGALIHQATPREIAKAHAVKLSTVRTQIQSIRSKFGSRNIESLLLRTAQMPMVTGTLRTTDPAPQHSARSGTI